MNKILIPVALVLLLTSCGGRTAVNYEEKMKSVKEESVNAYAVSGIKAGTQAEASYITSAAKPVTKAAAAAKPIRREKVPLNIESDSMTFNREQQLAVFKGNVIVSSKGVKVKSDVLKSKDYRQGAEAEGNVKAEYTQNNTVLTCKKIRYTDKMRYVTAIGSVKTKKILADGNTMTVYCDEVDFDTQENLIKAKKVRHRTRIEFRDITAFCDSLEFDEKNGELTLVGSPFFRKKRSLFLSETVKLDVNRKVITLEGKIFSKINYTEYAASKKEIENTPR